jgi:hypothetical protein
MSSSIVRARTTYPRRVSRRVSRGVSRRIGHRLAIVALVGGLAGVALTGCSVIGAAKKVATTVQGNSAVINLFTTNLSSGQPTSFEVTYKTTGATPSKIVYAVRPPNELAFYETQTGSVGSAGLGNFRLIVNSAGEYVCTQVASTWTCQKLPKSGSNSQRTLLDFYTPAHWINFLKAFSLAAGFAGDKVTSSSAAVNGFTLQCVDYTAAGIPGKSRICSTPEHLLDLVQVAGTSTGFEITAYSSSPAAALFALPPGAKVTTSGAG